MGPFAALLIVTKKRYFKKGILRKNIVVQYNLQTTLNYTMDKIFLWKCIYHNGPFKNKFNDKSPGLSNLFLFSETHGLTF